jgi:hypothetical protein
MDMSEEFEKAFIAVIQKILIAKTQALDKSRIIPSFVFFVQKITKFIIFFLDICYEIRYYHHHETNLHTIRVFHV